VISVALDGHGNLYLADPGEDDVGTRIRKVDASGRITTFAGTATQGFAGDGGPATSAQLHTPTGVAADVAGNVYIADSGNHRVRKVSPAGTISTVAGNGQQATSGDGGPATAAGVSPFSVAADGQGSLYISDAVNGRLRKVDASGRITTLAAVDEPGGLAVDAQGNVYVADVRKNRIRKVTPAGALSTVAGRSRPPFTGDYGPATGARLQSPTSVALDAQGNLFIADALNQRIEKVGDVSVPGIGGGCSRATAKRLFQRLRLGNTGYTPNPVAQVVCGAFFGKGSRTMATSETIPSCGRTGGWEVFNFAQGAWHLVLHRNNGADLFRVRGGIKEQQFVLRPGDAHCFPTGGTRSRIWRWNGTHWVHTAWKYRRSKR
jgi:sugar lactone lactonase YvrE